MRGNLKNDDTLCSDEIPALLSDWLVRLGNFSGTITKAYQRLRVS